MALNNSYWFQDTGLYNSVATQSLRFDSGSSTYLSRTPSSAGNRKTWTWSGWVKRAKISDSDRQIFFNSYNGSAPERSALFFDTSDKLVFGQGDVSANGTITTDAVFRDPSSWYHIVAIADFSNSTANNRAKLYVNGVLQTVTVNDGFEDANGFINSTNEHQVGAKESGGEGFDGYLSEVNFVDGTALDPTSFGETKNGVWIPKAYTGTYGTNGFRLEFKNTSVGTGSSSTIGADTSGNGNHYTSSGIVASDCNMPDSPENNFATFNSVDPSNPTFSEGNLKTAFSGAGKGSSRSTIGVASGKWYAEFYIITKGNGVAVGTLGEDASLTAWKSIIDGSVYVSGGLKNIDGTETSFGASYTDGDIIGVALDMDAGSITVYKNNTSQGEMDTGLSGEHFFSFSDASAVTTGTGIVNFGQDSSFAGNATAQGNTDANGIGDFYYSPPSGYLALCSANLPEPTISPNASTQADDYFNTVLYTGNGSTQSITGVGFQPDWVWYKRRSLAADHQLYDVIRGATKTLFPNSTSSETTGSTRLTSFDSDGFSLGSDGGSNGSGETFVAWNWKAGGTAVSNTDGSITSSVSANTDAGFSIVSYTGTGANATVGHGLNVAPNMIIVKNRNDSANWAVFSEEAGNGYWLLLNENFSKQSTTTMWNSTSPTSTVFSIGSANESNGSSDNMIAYCFHDVEGYSKFGGYTGNGSTDGTFVYTGFRPAWIMVKGTNDATQWLMKDSVRSPENAVDERLRANISDAENTGADVDFTSNGFKARHASNEVNASGTTYIYMAFAENPFKYANAR